MKKYITIFTLIALISGYYVFFHEDNTFYDYDKGLSDYNAGYFKDALKVFEPLAERDHVDAQYYLAEMYSNGNGKAKDAEESRYWYRKAGINGNTDAQIKLGYLFENRLIFLHDHSGLIGEDSENEYLYDVYAYVWYNIAASNGIKSGHIKREEIGKKLSMAQIKKAQFDTKKCLNGYLSNSYC